jgi:hypothetical protein
MYMRAMVSTMARVIGQLMIHSSMASSLGFSVARPVHVQVRLERRVHYRKQTLTQNRTNRAHCIDNGLFDEQADLDVHD